MFEENGGMRVRNYFWKELSNLTEKQKKELSFFQNTYFLNSISSQPGGVNLWDFILRYNRIHGLKYLRSTTLICQNKGIRKSLFVAKTQFLGEAWCKPLSKGSNRISLDQDIRLQGWYGVNINIIKTTFNFNFDSYEAVKQHGNTKIWKQSFSLVICKLVIQNKSD